MIIDIFCKVIDNYGDIGVCWRLTRELTDLNKSVNLYVDDLNAFKKINNRSIQTRKSKILITTIRPFTLFIGIKQIKNIHLVIW